MTTEMVPQQHSGSGSSGRYRCIRKSDGSVSCDERWGALGYRVPTGRRHGNEEERAKTNGHGANTSISYMQGHLIAVVSGYTFEACIFGQNEFHSGSRRSQDVVEVLVLVVLATVVVHGS